MKGYYISHGSPTILVENIRWKETLRSIGKKIENEVKPEVIVAISPHFLTWSNTHYVEVQERLECIQDYYGFPDALYKFCYDAENDVELAKEIVKLGSSKGIQIVEDTTWGLDHGVWIPLYFMFPNNKHKVVTISITDNSPREHFELGKVIKEAIERLNKRAIILATGSPTHRLDLYYMKIKPVMSKFDEILINLLNNKKFDEILNLENYKEYKIAMPEGDLKPLYILLGVIEPKNSQILDYDIPWAGVSMIAVELE
jgi:aromatic ring-opening dioxygenase catalytic subunit (LigB family)